MTAKKPGSYAQDSSKYATITDGSGTLVTVTKTTGSTKQAVGSQAPDGSIYMTLTNGAGSLI